MMMVMMMKVRSSSYYLLTEFAFCVVKYYQGIPGNDQNTSPASQKTAGSKLDQTS